MFIIYLVSTHAQFGLNNNWTQIRSNSSKYRIFNARLSISRAGLHV